MKTIAATPPTRQSTYEQMSCEKGYSLIHIEGIKPPETPPSARGTDVHEALARYAEHCAQKRIKVDFAFMDQLAANLGPDAATILDTCKGSVEIDYENFFAAEASMGLDEDFRPTYSLDHDGHPVPFDESLWGPIASGKPPAYCAVLDVIYLMPGGKVARIPDYKTHPRPFDPSTFQGKEYPLFLFMHLPDLEEIEFGLRFVRYPNIVKTIKLYREDVPELMAECRRVRARQKDIAERYAAGLELRVHSGKHCCYCPALIDLSCPIREMNPQANMSPADRLNFRLWLDQANRANNQAMKDYVEGTGQEIHGQDANGKHYIFGPQMKTKSSFPLFTYTPERGLQVSPAIDKIIDWATVDAPEDCIPTKRSPIPWPAKLVIGSTQLKSPLKANKRADLHQWFQDNAMAQTDDIQLRVQRDAEVDDGTGEEYRDYSGYGEE